MGLDSGTPPVMRGAYVMGAERIDQVSSADSRIFWIFVSVQVDADMAVFDGFFMMGSCPKAARRPRCTRTRPVRGCSGERCSRNGGRFGAELPRQARRLW